MCEDLRREFLGLGTVGVEPVSTWNKARSVIELCLRSSVGKVLKGGENDGSWGFRRPSLSLRRRGTGWRRRWRGSSG